MAVVKPAFQIKVRQRAGYSGNYSFHPFWVPIQAVWRSLWSRLCVRSPLCAFLLKSFPVCLSGRGVSVPLVVLHPRELSRRISPQKFAGRSLCTSFDTVTFHVGILLSVKWLARASGIGGATHSGANENPVMVQSFMELCSRIGLTVVWPPPSLLDKSQQ